MIVTHLSAVRAISTVEHSFVLFTMGQIVNAARALGKNRLQLLVLLERIPTTGHRSRAYLMTYVAQLKNAITPAVRSSIAAE